MKTLKFILPAGLLAAVVVLGGCGQHEKPNRVYMPDMAYSPAVKALEPGSARVPPAGTIPRDFEVYPFAGEKDPEVPGRMLKNPLQPTAAVLQRGQALFNTFCIVCHGPTAWGNGFIVPRFPKPPSLHADRAKAFADGRIFHVITTGQNLMPTYKTQISKQDRWAIIHYVRVLQGLGTPVPPQAWGPAPEPPMPVASPSPGPNASASPTAENQGASK